MLIVRLQGGLGNQMFQCAFAYMLSIKNKEHFLLDTSLFREVSTTSRSFELDKFESRLQTVDLSFLFNRLVYIKARGLQHCDELCFEFNSHHLTFRNTIVTGYFQSEKYFKDFRGEILKLFSFNPKLLSNATLNVANKIKHSNSVSIHIRRGDYISDSATFNFHGCCTMDYYNKAANLISKSVPDCNFFVFSDDIEWAKKNIKLEGVMHFISHNTGKDSYQDMYLMSLCKHNILANSTFSWWAAWLNTYKNKIVITPKNWFRNEVINTKDLIPADWTKI